MLTTDNKNEKERERRRRRIHARQALVSQLSSSYHSFV